MLPILCYHKVGESAEEGRFLNVSPALLASHIAFFRRRGYRGIAARNLAQAWPEKGVCFTFDDAYLSAVSSAPPLLLAADFSGTFYAVPSLVGASSAWDGDKARPLAGWSALRTLSAQGFEVGNHTLTHPHLTDLDLDGQRREIAAAQARLLEEGLAPGSFCMPYGHYDRETVQVLQQVGLPVGLTLRKGLAGPGDPLLELPRVVVGFSDALPKLIYKIWVKPKLRPPAPPVPGIPPV